MSVRECGFSIKPDDIAWELFNEGSDGDYVLERFWKIVVQRLIDEGADIEFFYDRRRRNMDFQLRSTDRLIYEVDESRAWRDTILVFKWQRTDAAISPRHEQGLYSRDRLMSIDFVTDGDLKRAIKRMYEKRANVEAGSLATIPPPKSFRPWLSEKDIRRAIDAMTSEPLISKIRRAPNFIIIDDLIDQRPGRIIEHESDKD
jgi:hypothetical protein